MAAAQSNWFVLTANLKKAIHLTNDLDPSKFTRLLRRIVLKLHSRDERIFTEEEEEKLQVALELNRNDVEILLDALSFILEQAAYHCAKPAVLKQQLEAIQLNEEKVLAVLDIWSENGISVITKLRKRSLAPKKLDSINWRLNLQLAQANKSKMKLTNAFFELGLSASDPKNDEKVRMEFTHDELYEFFNKLETIQNQLDSLRS